MLRIPDKIHEVREMALERLRYDDATGQLHWKVRVARRVQVGDIAGTAANRDGYRRIAMGGKYILAHRLVWLMHTGNWPSQDLDHINGVKTDNRLENLRDVARQTNAQNQHAATARNALGLLGVSRQKYGYRGSIVVDNKQTHLGTFKTPELAHEAYLKAKRAMHQGCTI